MNSKRFRVYENINLLDCFTVGKILKHNWHFRSAAISQKVIFQARHSKTIGFGCEKNSTRLERYLTAKICSLWSWRFATFWSFERKGINKKNMWFEEENIVVPLCVLKSGWVYKEEFIYNQTWGRSSPIWFTTDNSKTYSNIEWSGIVRLFVVTIKTVLIFDFAAFSCYLAGLCLF